MQTRWRGSLFALALAAACAGAPPKPAPPWATAGDVEVARYPRSQFITAVGRAPTAEQADAAAHSGVAQQISARLKVEISSWASTTGSSDAQKYIEKIQLNSEFSHDDLVRIADRGEAGGVAYSLAVLDRAEAEAALARDVASEEARFAAAADRALAARRDRQAGQFTAAAAEAQSALPAIESSYVLRRAVLKHASAAESAHVARRNALIAALVEARSRRVVDVRLEGGHFPPLLERAVSAVKRLGLRVAEGKGCDAQSQEALVDATELVLSTEESCGAGSFGPKCQVSVRLHARGCAGGGEGEGRIPNSVSESTSDEQHAKAKAWGKITGDLVEAAVKEALQGTLSAGGSQ